MKGILKTSILPALIGGLAVAAAFLVAGVGGSDTTTVVQQSPLAAPVSDSSGGALTAQAIYKRDAPGVVYIRSSSTTTQQSPFDLFPQQQRSEATGSGFVTDQDGHILTNWHVVQGADRVTVQFGDEKSVEAKVLGSDPSTDIAVLKVDTKGLDLHPLQFGDSSRVQVGDPTVAIGNPFGLDRTLTTGVVSALQRRIQAPNDFTIDHVIQTDAAINPGNSGGPLIDALGRVIGINSQIATGGSGNGSVGIGFAVPINTAKGVMSQIIKDGSVQHAYLGISGRTIDDSLSSLNLAVKRGVLLQQVTPGGPAAKAGLRAGSDQVSINGDDVVLGGDVIQKIDGKPITSMDQLATLVAAKRPGDEITVTYLRGGDTKTAKVKLAKRPAALPNG